MTDRLEQLLREAQQRRAADAPDPDRVRRALPVLVARRTRRRRIGLAGGAVLAAAAVLATVLFAPGGGTTSRIPADVPSSSSPSPSPSAVPSVAADLTRSFAPGWLPPGFRERRRAVVATSDGARAVRYWAKAPLGTDLQRLNSVPYVVVATMLPPYEPGGTLVDVGGRTGWYNGPKDGEQVAHLAWRADQDAWVVIQTNSVTAQADLLRVAVSVHLDPTPLRQPLVIGWAPFERREYTYSYGGDNPAGWSANITISDPSDPTPPTASLSAKLASDTDVPEGGRTVQVGGVTGRLLVEESPERGNPRQCVVLPQPGGRLLTVCSYIAGPDGPRMPEEHLLRAAGSVDTTMRADTGWLG